MIFFIATSIHWLNPLMYFVKKEINHACELACDEPVIKNLNPSEKQAYGNTLISVVAESKYPFGVLQAAMCEEKLLVPYNKLMININLLLTIDYTYYIIQ